MSQRRKIGIFTGGRAEYGLLHPIIQKLLASDQVEPVLYVSGAHLSAQYGNTLEEIERDGAPIALQLPMPELGQNMGVECGFLTQTMSRFFENPNNRPDCVLVLGDRYETLGVSIAAFLNRIVLAHVHGGDVVRGGMQDEPIRHAITKLANLHFPITQESANRILAMGEEPWRVTVVGSPALDNIRQLPMLEKSHFVQTYGLDPEKPWVLFTQHPLTIQSELAGEQARQTLSALASLGEDIQVVATYPNPDQGSDAIIRELEGHFASLPQFRMVKSLGRVNYLNILRYVALVVGNSSSGLLETAHFNVPCLNIGERQKGRERGENVVNVPQDEDAIRAALRDTLFNPETRRQLQNGRHPFGVGDCAQRILEVLSTIKFDQDLLCKQLTY